MRDLLGEDGSRENTDKSSRNAIVATKASEADVIKRSVKNLRTSGDGGEKDMDKVIQQNFTLRTIKAKLGSKFTPWKRDVRGCRFFFHLGGLQMLVAHCDNF